MAEEGSKTTPVLPLQDMPTESLGCEDDPTGSGAATKSSQEVPAGQRPDRPGADRLAASGDDPEWSRVAEETRRRLEQLKGVQGLPDSGERKQIEDKAYENLRQLIMDEARKRTGIAEASPTAHGTDAAAGRPGEERGSGKLISPTEIPKPASNGTAAAITAAAPTSAAASPAASPEAQQDSRALIPFSETEPSSLPQGADGAADSSGLASGLLLGGGGVNLGSAIVDIGVASSTGAAAVGALADSVIPGAGAADAELSLVLVELSHGAKRKRLQLKRATTIGQVIEQYGKVVKGSGEVVIVDQDGIEHSRDITLAMLAEEANLSASGTLLRLELRLDD